MAIAFDRCPPPPPPPLCPPVLPPPNGVRVSSGPPPMLPCSSFDGDLALLPAGASVEERKGALVPNHTLRAIIEAAVTRNPAWRHRAGTRLHLRR